MMKIEKQIKRLMEKREVMQGGLELFVEALGNAKTEEQRSEYFEKVRRCVSRISMYNDELEELFDKKAAMEKPALEMNLQLLAKKDDKEVEKELTEAEISASMEKALKAGFEVKNPCQAHMVNNFDKLFNDKFYMKENNKTDRIPVFNLPNIKIQRDILQLIKNNPHIYDLVPVDQKERFEEFVNYLKNNKMCVNCQTCKETCYNNKAYTQYPTKALCDLRQLYRVIEKPHAVAGEIVQNTINTKNARLNGSGEIHNEFILDFYKKVAKMNKDTKYYTYTKNYDLILGRKLPSNLIINLSDYGTGHLIEERKDKIQKNQNIFKAVTPEELEVIKADKELSKNICWGESCSTCRLCTTKKGITIFCPIH